MELKIEYIAVEDLKPYEKNTRKHEKKDVDNIAKSIEKYGMCDAIGIWKDNIIVEGHGRLLACKQLGIKEVPCVRLDHLTDEQRREYAIAHNATAELSIWDKDFLAEELADLDLTDFDFDFGFNDNISDKYTDKTPGALKEKFIMPPFSVLDARQGDWQKRKKAWLKIIDSGKGRKDNLLGDGITCLLNNSARGETLTATSIFDPVLCEILINWFSPKGAKIIDPFAGGSVRGIVSQFLQRDYYGNDLSKEQIEANVEQFEQLENSTDFFGEKLKMPKWSVGDSKNIDKIITENDFDMLLTCPPYADLEVYSDDPADISNMEYEDFLSVYEEIFEKSISKLKENAFICVVVGEVRDNNGHYRNFIGDTIKAVEKTGAKYYNEIVLVTMGGTLPLRAGRTFSASRKVANSHQKALVFLKSNGDESALQEYLSDFENERRLTPMKKSILVFLRGNSKLAKSDMEKYEFELF
jgi:DNA modification methylase